RPSSAKANACSQPPPVARRLRSGNKKTASSRQSRSRSYKSGTSPRASFREEVAHSWTPYSLPSTAISSPTAHEISEKFLQSLMEGDTRRSLVEMSPYQQELAHLRLQRLRVEEELLLELKRQQELERTRGPKPKWYEMKGSQFHYEARKNNELLRTSKDWQSLFNYRQELLSASKEFSQNHQHSTVDPF
uniref:Uncharacterized protein n=1 Tax=Latimeria chalumnae TaxID=7897 RepID=H3BIR4_LATCH